MSETTLDQEARAARQRDFYLKLLPNGVGHSIAQRLAGYVNPDMDSCEEEVKDSLSLWFKVNASGASSLIRDTSWWMAGFQDSNRRLSKDEFTQRTEELGCFAVATLGQLLDAGVLRWANEPEIPKLVTSTHGMVDEADKGVLDRLEKSTWKVRKKNDE